MTISRKKRKVKRKARTQRKKATVIRKKKITRKKKRSVIKQPIASNGVKKRKPTRAQLEKQLQQAQQKIRKLTAARQKKNRSAAAKRGWETRRRKKAEKSAVAMKEAETIAGIVFSQIDIERIEFFRRPEVIKQIRDLFIEKIPEYFIEGPQWIEQEEPSMIRRLIYGEVEGIFDEVAHEIAEESGYEPHEIYSLWWGYKLE